MNTPSGCKRVPLAMTPPQRLAAMADVRGAAARGAADGGSGGGRIPLGPSQRRAAAVRGRPGSPCLQRGPAPGPARPAAPTPARCVPKCPAAKCPRHAPGAAPPGRLSRKSTPRSKNTDIFPAPKIHVKLTPSASRVFVVVVGLFVFFASIFLLGSISPPHTHHQKSHTILELDWQL